MGLLPVRRIVVLVHPFYSIYNWPYVVDGNSKQVREGVNFLMAIWRKRLKVAAKRPGTVVILLRAGVNNEYVHERLKKMDDPKLIRAIRWIELKTAAFERVLKRKLKKQLIVISDSRGLSGSFSGMNIRKKLRDNGFGVSHRVRGQLFGEYFDYCVRTERDTMLEQLGVPSNRVYRHPTLSMGVPTYGVHPRTLGNHYAGIRERYHSRHPRAKRNH